MLMNTLRILEMIAYSYLTFFNNNNQSVYLKHISIKQILIIIKYRLMERLTKYNWNGKKHWNNPSP